MQSDDRVKVWVKFPDKPTVKSLITCFRSLVSQLDKVDPQKPVTNIKLNKQEKALEIEFDV